MPTLAIHFDCFDHVHTSDSCVTFGRQDYDDNCLFSTCNEPVTEFSDLIAETSKFTSDVMNKTTPTCNASISKFSDAFAATKLQYDSIDSGAYVATFGLHACIDIKGASAPRSGGNHADILISSTYCVLTAIQYDEAKFPPAFAATLGTQPDCINLVNAFNMFSD